MNILVTGGCGYIGSAFVRLASNHYNNIMVMDDLSTGHIQNIPLSKVLFYNIRLSEQRRIYDLISSGGIDTVVHFAAKAVVQESVEYPHRYWQGNVAGSLSLFGAAKMGGIKKLILSSTCAVYGHDQFGKLSEGDSLQPINPYGQTKLMVEEIAKSYAESCGWDLTILRYFNAAGAEGIYGERHDPETHIIPNVIRTALSQQEHLNIYGEDNIRDFVHITDLAEVHELALKKGSGIQTFNVGTSKGWSVKDIVSLVEFHHGQPIKNKTVHPAKSGDPRYLVADCSKIKKEWGWVAKRDIYDIIRSAYTFHKEHY